MPEQEVQGVNGHPGIETLSAYVDRTLGDRERREVEAHIAGCEECYELVTEVVRSQTEVSDEAAPAVREITPVAAPERRVPQGKVVPFTRRRRVLVGAAGLTAAAAVLFVWIIPTNLPFGESGGQVEKLVAVVGNQRLIEARLTGGFEYGPLQSPLRSGSPASASLPLLTAVADLQHLAQASPDVGALHAWGVGLLLARELDLAIDTLQAVARQRPDDAAVANDLGAAYLTRAQALGRSDDWARALTAIDEGLRRDPRQVEALFNRALALTALEKRDEAKLAWEVYLARDPGSPWNEEARRQLASLGSGSGR